MLPQWSRGAPGPPLSERKINSDVEKEVEELGTSYSSSYLYCSRGSLRPYSPPPLPAPPRPPAKELSA